MAVYKSIMSGGGRNLFFALVDDKTDRVETIDLKKWLKSNVRDNSSKDSKERVIKAILRNEKQFNKKVDFNMWAKKTKPSFEQTMDYFMKNGFVSNITKKGIKVYEGVESVNEGKKRFKRQDGIGKAKYTISYHDGKKKHKDGSDFFDIKIFKNKKDLSDFVGTLVKQGYKLTNEDKGEVEKIKKQAGKNEIKFYDALSKVEKRLGSKYPKFLDTALKQLKQNPSSLKTNADKEEKLFNLVK